MESAYDLAGNAIELIAVGVLLYVAWNDSRSYTIRNRVNLVLLCLYLVRALLLGFDGIFGDLAAAMVLFLPALALWFLRAIGGGDVKLYFVVGLFVGLQGLGLFAVALMVVTILFLIAIRLASLSSAEIGVMGRLKQIHQTGKAPYAVIISGAAIPVMLMRLIADI